MKSPQFFHCSNCTQLINSLPALLQMSSSVIKDRKENSSPDASERLRPEKSEKSSSSRHYRNNHDFHRRRHHRRANKRGRRNHRPRDSSPSNINLDTSNNEGQSSSSSRSHAHGGHSHRRPPPTSKNLILRPTKGPLLNAPKNSTQFIIDDHETSPLLGPIHEGGAVAHPMVLPEVHQQQQPHQQPKKYNTRSRQGSTSSSRQVSACSVGPPDERMELVRSPDKSASNDCQATPGNYVVNDDDYTLWAEFSERDFQSVYESAHQEEVADWDRQKLIEEITNLEKRQKELVNVLAKVDPDMYAQRLQTQLQALQEKNRLLRNANGLSPVGPNHLNLENIAMDQQEPEKSPPYKSPDSSTKDD